MPREAYGNFAGKHLVIFGCGYIGGEVAKQALERGIHVTALTRNPDKAATLREAGATVVVAELAAAAWHSQLAGADLALVCMSSGGGGVESYRQSYLAGMKSVLAWTEQRGTLQSLVYTSSTSVYPQGEGARVDETSAVGGRDERSAVLVETEALVQGNASAARNRVILRLAGIYGPGRTHLLKQVRAGGVAGTALHHLNLIHRDDVCGAIWAAFAAPAEGEAQVFNVADDGGATRAEITAWLAAQFGLPSPRFSGEPTRGRSPTPDRVIANTRLKERLGWTLRWPTYREGYAGLLSS